MFPALRYLRASYGRFGRRQWRLYHRTDLPSMVAGSGFPVSRSAACTGPVGQFSTGITLLEKITKLVPPPMRRLQTANPVTDSVSVLWLLHSGIAPLPKLVGLSRQWFLRVSFLGTVLPALLLCGSPAPVDPADTRTGSEFVLPSAADWRVRFHVMSSQC